MLRQLLAVPIDYNNKPDYKFMENCARKMVIKKYLQYLHFLESSRI